MAGSFQFSDSLQKRANLNTWERRKRATALATSTFWSFGFSFGKGFNFVTCLVASYQSQKENTDILKNWHSPCASPHYPKSQAVLLEPKQSHSKKTKKKHISEEALYSAKVTVDSKYTRNSTFQTRLQQINDQNSDQNVFLPACCPGRLPLIFFFPLFSLFLHQSILSALFGQTLLGKGGQSFTIKSLANYLIR